MKKPTLNLILVSLCLIFLFLGSTLLFSQEWIGNVITDPAISKRCDDLAKKREQKLGHKQKLMALLKRNTHLQKVAPKNRHTVKLKLEINEGQLNQELDLTRLTIEQIEEGIIRKGCPGIVL